MVGGICPPSLNIKKDPGQAKKFLRIAEGMGNVTSLTL